MRRVCLCMIFSVGVFAQADLFAQSSDGSQTRRSITANEYIQSTSPLKNGGSVTSRVQPGRNVQTVTTIANLPVLGAGRAAARDKRLDLKRERPLRILTRLPVVPPQRSLSFQYRILRQ